MAHIDPESLSSPLDPGMFKPVPESAGARAGRILADPEGGVLPAAGSLLMSGLPEAGRADGWAKDTAVDVATAPVVAGQTAVGIANLLSAGRAGNLLASVGYDPKAALSSIGERYSDNVKRQQQNVEQISAAAEKNLSEASGAWDTTQAILGGGARIAAGMVTNPHAIQTQVTQSLPDLLMGAGIVGGAAKRIAAKGGEEALSAASNKLSWLGHGVEGLQAAGQNAEAVRQEDPNNVAGMYAQLGAAVTTPLIGRGVSKALGGDIQTAAQLALAGPKGAAAKQLGDKFSKSLPGQLLKSSASEGIQETGQSGAEHAWQNLGTGNPLGEGVLTQSAQGGVTGAAMGVGQSVIAGRKKDAPAAPPAPPLEERVRETAGAVAAAAVAANDYLSSPNPSSGQLPARAILADATGIDTSGPLGSAAAAAVASGATDRATNPQDTQHLFPFRNQKAAQDYINAQPDPDLYTAGAHPNIAGRTAVFPKTGPELRALLESRAVEAAKIAQEQQSQLLAEQEVPEERTVDTETKLGRFGSGGTGKVTSSRQPDGRIEVTVEGDKGDTQTKHSITYDSSTTREQAVKKATAELGGFTPEAPETPEQTKVRKAKVKEAQTQLREEEAAQAELQPKTAQPTSETPIAQQRAAAQAQRAKSSNETRAKQLADEETPAAAAAVPAEAQIAAGNYKKGHLKIGGIPITVENPEGSTRTGTEKGRAWKTTMKARYGYIKGTSGADKAQVDAFVRPGTSENHKGPVFVIDQYDPGTKRFDEHKVMVGYGSAAEASAAYDAHYNRGSGPKRRGAITRMTNEGFRQWVAAGGSASPVSGHAFGKPVSTAEDAAQEEIAASTGKMSLPRMAKNPGETDSAFAYRRAAAANTRRAAAQQALKPAKTPESHKQQIGDALNQAPEGISIVAPEALSDTGEGLTRQAALFARDVVGKMFGKSVVFFKEPGRTAEGFYAFGDTIYLNAEAATAHLATLGHELSHAMEKESPKAYRDLVAAVSQFLTNQELLAQYENYFQKALPDVAYLDRPFQGESTLRVFLTKEWLGDLAGNRFLEAEFWEKVFTTVEETYGTKAGKSVVARLKDAFLGALSKLREFITGNKFAVDERLTDKLDAIRDAVAEAFSSYATAVKLGAIDDTQGDGVAFSKPKKEKVVKPEAEPAAIERGKTVYQSDPLTQGQWEALREIALEGLSPEDRAAALEDETRYLAEEGHAGRHANGLAELGAKVLRMRKVPSLSTVAIVNGKEIVEVKRSSKTGDKPTLRDAAVALKARVKGPFGNLETPEGRTAMAEAMLHEIAYAVTKAGSAVGWYDRTVREALAIIAMVRPKIRSSREANFIIRVALAITSNGLSVRDNFALGMEVFDHWEKNGKLPEEVPSGGQTADAMGKSFVRINAELEKGFDAVEADLLTVRTVGELFELYGYKVGGELVSEKVPTAAMYGGPKIGNFLANLSGHFDSPTIDRWFMRTIGRLSGILLFNTGTAGVNARDFLEKFKASGNMAKTPMTLEELEKEVAAFEALSPEDQKIPENAIDLMPGVMALADAQFAEFSAPDENKKTFSKRTPLNEASRRVHNGVGAMITSPRHGSDRHNIRLLVNQVLGMLKKRGINMNAADLQAVLWYHEKHLYEALGAANASAKPWNYASAARFAVGRALGLVDVGAPRGTRSVRARQPAAAGVSAGVEAERPAAGDNAVRLSSYRGVNLEVAPNPNDAAAVEKFESISENAKKQVTERVAGKMIPKLLRDMGLKGAAVEYTIGGFLGKTNPAFIVHFDRQTSFEDVQEFAKVSGAMLRQEAAIAFDEDDTKSGTQTTFVYVKAEVPLTYDEQAALFHHVTTNFPQAAGFTGRDGVPAFGNFEEGLSDDDFHAGVDAALAGLPGGHTLTTRKKAFRSEWMQPVSNEGTRYDDSEESTIRWADSFRGQGVFDSLREEADKEFNDALAAVKFSLARPDAAGSGRFGSTVPEGFWGQIQREAVSAIGVHYSRSQREVLGSGYYGQGLSGAERDRVFNDPDTRLRQRIYFYVNAGKGVKPEAGVGAHAHIANLENLYDYVSDPLDLRVKSSGPSAFESSVLDAGFAGVVNHGLGMAVLIGPRQMPVQYLGEIQPEVAQAPRAALSWYGEQRRILDTTEGLPSGQMTGAAWLDLLAKLAPSVATAHIDPTQRYYKDELVRKPGGSAMAAFSLARTAVEDSTGYYGSIETRPGTTAAQKAQGTRAMDALLTAINRMRGPGGEPSTILGSRLYADFVASGTNRIKGQRINNASDLAALAQVYRDPRYETLRAIFVKDGKVVGESAYSNRLPGSVRFSPALPRDLTDDMARFDATGAYLLHNHPAGDPTPSRADILVTQELYRVMGEKLRGHVVIDHNSFSEIGVDGQVAVRNAPELGGVDFKNTPAVPHPLLGYPINSTSSLAIAGKLLRDQAQTAPTMIMTKGARGEVELVAALPPGIVNFFGVMRERAKAWVRGVGSRSGAGGSRFLVLSDKDFLKYSPAIRKLISEGIFTDVVNASGDSFMNLEPGKALETMLRPPEDLFKGRRVAMKLSTARLAPNGKPSKLTEEQWKQVRTPEFKAWFGDWEKVHNGKDGNGAWYWPRESVSKMVDENGEPRVYYHGTELGGFTVMDPKKGDKHRAPMVFTAESRRTSATYSGSLDEISPTGQPDTWEDFKAVGYDVVEIPMEESVFGARYFLKYPTGQVSTWGRRDIYEISRQAEQDFYAWDPEDGDPRPDIPYDAKGIYSLFLNIREPMETDFHGADWTGQHESPTYMLMDNADNFYENESGEYVFTEAQIAEEKKAIEARDGWNRFTSEVRFDPGTTNTVAQEARSRGMDGVIIRNVIDHGEYGHFAYGPDTVVVFFDATQAKSALFNQGAFSSNNPDIRMSLPRTVMVGGVERPTTNSNGKPLAQDEAGIRNFWQWFGDSKVVDAQGRPLVVYHGTRSNFSRFENTGGIVSTIFGSENVSRQGFFFTDSPNIASEFAEQGTRPNGSNVVPTYLAISSPLDLYSAGVTGSILDEFERGGINPRWLLNFDWSSFDGEDGTNFVAAVRRLGYDGVFFLEENADRPGSFMAYTAFEPTQIKSAIGNMGAFSPNNPDIRYSAPRAEFQFYSALSRAVEQAPAKAFGKASQIKLWLAGNKGKLGIKDDEIQWSGISEWLDLKPGEVKSREEVLGYLAQNGVKVEEVNKGATYVADVEAWWNDEGGATEEVPFAYLSQREQDDAIARYTEETAGDEGTTKYNKYQLPGGQNYRELLLTLPSKSSPGVSYVVRGAYPREFPTRRAAESWIERQISTSKTPGYEGIAEDLRRDPLRIEEKPIQIPVGTAYHSPHWDEPNVLAHIRLNDRTDADGNKVLFVEEVQSDWGQVGKRKGFDRPRVTEEVAYREGKQPVPGAPFVTRTEAWLQLALKRVVGYAAENGYDKVAFITGDQSAERYDLSLHVSAINYGDFRMGKDEETLYLLEAYNHSGELIFNDDGVGIDRAEEVFGKDIAKKIEAKEGSVLRRDNGVTWRSLEGLDLKVGGEGMRTFYDTMVPKAVKEVLRKVGGGQLQDVDFLGIKSKALNRWEELRAKAAYGKLPPEQRPELQKLDAIYNIEKLGKFLDNQLSLQPGITITPELRTRILGEGFPLFSMPRAAGAFDPVKTKTGYKLFQTKAKSPGQLFPLFIGAKVPVPIGRWIPAENIPTKGFQKRPGWHAGVLPLAPHLRGKDGRMNQTRVWAEVELPDDVDWQPAADASGTGDIRDQVPVGGSYRFKTPKLQGGAWVIGGALRVKRVLRDDEVRAILTQAGIDPAEAEAETHSDPEVLARFSRPRPGLGALNAAQEAAALRVLGEPKTFAQKLAEWRQHWKKSLVQGLVDQFAPIAELDQGAYIKARMSRGGDSTLEALMLYGKLRLGADGAPVVNYTRAGGLQGFASKMAGLKGEHERFLLWVAATRAARLKTIGLENLFSVSDIAALRTLDQGNLQDGTPRAPAFAQALADLNDFNDNVLKLAADSGLIDDATRKMYQGTPYIPFYRLQEEGSPGFGVSPGLVNQYAWKKLKGGTDPLKADLLANMLQNWSHLITASAKNRAAKASLDAAVLAGAAQEVAGSMGAWAAAGGAAGPLLGPGTKGQLSYRDAGKERSFLVTDPHVLDAVAALHYAGLGPWSKPLTAMKHWLTLGVTSNPAFKIRNLIRDTVQSMATGQLSYNALDNLRTGWSATEHASETRAQLLASGGMIRFGSMLDGQQSDHAKDLIDSGVPSQYILDDGNKLKQFWRKVVRPAMAVYNEFGDRTEQVNRAALYEQLLAKGMTNAEAAFWARDLMDFSSSGKWTAIRTLTQTVPFLNARLQGLYKLGRSSKQDTRRVGAVIGAVALASLALLLLYEDDEDWRRRSDTDRANYWWFKVGGIAYRVPKPFEIGAIGTMAERGYELMFDKEMTGRRFGKNMRELVMSQLSMNPTPQLFKPMIDVYANKDAFTGRDIETAAERKRTASERYDEKTSEVARFLGSLGLPDPVQLAMGRWDQVSPKQFDYLARGYFSWLGVMTTTALDYGIRPMLDRGARPALRLQDTFFVGNFAESLPGGSSRYVQQLYDNAREVEEAYASWRHALKVGRVEHAQELLEDNRDLLAKRRAFEAVKRAEALANAQLQRVAASTDLSAEEKRARLDEIMERKNRLAQAVR